MHKEGIQVYRGGCLESVHHIHIAVVDSKRKLLYFFGDPARPTFARSAMKPFQAIPVINVGAVDEYNLEAKDIALMCASHNGEVQHRERVLSILEKVGQREDVLKCGTHIPRDIESYKALIREGKELTPVFSNCSGKHSGMIATAVYMNENLENYYLLDHPIQQRILQMISDLLDYPKEDIKIGIDGCGVPVHQLPLNYIALAFAYLANPDSSKIYSKELKIIRDAMMSYPEMVAGKDRFNTDAMKAFNGLVVSKSGAEGVQCIGDIESGIGIAIKTEDGNGRAADVAMMEVLKQLGIGNSKIYEKLEKYVEKPIKNKRDEIIGSVKPAFKLRSL